jgi:hypothetical protein
MASPRQIAANRSNAQRSTGPRTAAGKARARANATRHGLGTPAAALPSFAEALARLARELAGDHAGDGEVFAAATRVAEAAIDVLRARHARQSLIERIHREGALPAPPEAEDEETPRLPPRPPQPSKAALAQAVLDGRWPEIQAAWVSRLMQEGRHRRERQQRREAKIRAGRMASERVSDWRKLERLDRYERRALSRRRAALGDLDALLAARRSGLAPGDRSAPR